MHIDLPRQAIGLVLILGGGVGWFSLNRRDQSRPIRKIPRKMLGIVFRVLGFIFLLLGKQSGSTFGFVLIALPAASLLIFPSFWIQVVFVPGSRESRFIGRLLSIAVVYAGLLALVVPLKKTIREPGPVFTGGASR